MKKLLKTFMLLALSISIASCGKKEATNNNETKETTTKEVSKEEGFKINPIITNEGNPIKGGTLNVAILSGSPFKGVFHEAFVQDTSDETILRLIKGSSFQVDKNFKTTKSGPCSVEYKADEKKAIISINENYKWSDGVPVTAKDFVRYYLIVGNKDYEGVNFSGDHMNVVGMKEYKSGQTDNISGLKVIDDKHLEITFNEFNNSVLLHQGIPNEPVPDHVYKDIPVSEQIAHDATRKNPISAGPFTFEEIIPGEQIVAKPNEHYYLDKVKVDKLVIKFISGDKALAAAKSGEFDIIYGISPELYPQFSELKNGKIATEVSSGFKYIGFKVGKLNQEKKEAEMDSSLKTSDKDLRVAMAKAIDKEAINNNLLGGLNIPLYQMTIPKFKSYYINDFEGVRYDLEGAKKLLDEAGYKDTDNDGFREDKNGKPLEIKLAAMMGSSTEEPSVQYMLQQWKSIGLKVSLVDGKLMEGNAFYDKVLADDPEIDLFIAGFSLANTPNPSEIYSKQSPMNITRVTSPELDKIFADFDVLNQSDDKIKDIIKTFSEYMVNNGYVIPLFSNTSKVFVNNRVNKFDISITPKDEQKPFLFNEIELLKEEPVR